MALLLVGAGVSVVGLIVRAWAAGTVDKSRTLTTSGPYAFTRNPLYLGSFLIGVGLALAGGQWLWPVIFLAFFLAVYVPTMAREAEALADTFETSFFEYAAEVPLFLPRLTPYRVESSTRNGFRWKRYLRHREWEALLGVAAALVWLTLKVA
jgi:protein-S-isoprenylcysteine O-methyltransferase Ste14